MPSATLTKKHRIDLAKNFIGSFTATDKNTVYAAIAKSSDWEDVYQISAISQTNPIIVTCYNHGLSNGDIIKVSDVSGMVEINNWTNSPLVVANKTDDSFEIVGVDARQFTTYIGGGKVTFKKMNTFSDVHDNDQDIIDFWHEALAMKRLDATNVSLVIPRNNWAQNVIYDQYNYSDQNLDSKKYYVINSDNRVYKCLWNGRGAPSLTEPTSTSLTSFLLPDGYVWKYLFTLSNSDLNNFTNANWIPVKTLSSDNGSDQWNIQKTAIAGTIDNIEIVNSGIGYNWATTTIEIEGNGTGATAVVEETGVTNDKKLISIKMTNSGRNYTWANIIIKDTSGGHGAFAKALISPPKGHGSDPVSELNAYYVMINATFSGDENKTFFVDNNFRKYALIKQPLEGDKLAVKNSYDLRTKISVGAVQGNFIKDEIITGNTSKATAYVTSVENDSVYVTEINGVFQTNEVITSSGTGLANIIKIDESNIKKMSGELVYIENRNFIDRSATQSELLKTIITF